MAFIPENTKHWNEREQELRLVKRPGYVPNPKGSGNHGPVVSKRVTSGLQH